MKNLAFCLVLVGGCTEVVLPEEGEVPVSLNGLHLVGASCGDDVNALVNGVVAGAKVCLDDEVGCDVYIVAGEDGCEVVSGTMVKEEMGIDFSAVQCGERRISLDRDGVCEVDGGKLEGDASMVCEKAIGEVRKQVREFCEDGEALKVLGELAGYLDWALSRVGRVYDEAVEVKPKRSGDRLEQLLVKEGGVEVMVTFHYVGMNFVQFDLEVDGRKYVLQRPWESSANWLLIIDGKRFVVAPWGEREILPRGCGAVFGMVHGAMAKAPLSSNSGSVQE